MEQNTQFSMPKIGDKAPEFTAISTQGKINFPNDYKGEWVILFGHPGDFSSVCTSEFVIFASMQEELARMNCRLVGISVDGLSSHIAWLKAIKDKIEFNGHKNMNVEFPLIEDISMNVSRLYGMIQPGASTTKAVRAVFFIDPESTVRAVIYYPFNLGRNFAEIKRVLLGLQTVDAFGVALPADWQPGKEVIVSAPATMKEVYEREEKGTGSAGKCRDWFFCTKELPEEEIEKKIKIR